MIPLYGFLEGDSLGLLLLANEDETIESLREKLKRSAAVRVAPREGGLVYLQGKELDLLLKVKDSGAGKLDRIDVCWPKNEKKKNNDEINNPSPT